MVVLDLLPGGRANDPLEAALATLTVTRVGFMGIDNQDVEAVPESREGLVPFQPGIQIMVPTADGTRIDGVADPAHGIGARKGLADPFS